MNKITTIALSTIVAGSLFSTQAVYAQNVVPIKISEENIIKEDESKFIKFSGVISKVKNDGEVTLLTVKNSHDSLEMILRVTEDSLNFNSGTTEKFVVEDFEEGLEIEAYYDKNKPMIMIYPATVTPEIIIINEPGEMGQVKVGKFDENLVSSDHELKLHIDEDTILIDEKGDGVEKAELINKELIVFYTISTKSIPAQTTPSKIIALTETTETMEQVLAVINEDYYMNNETKMIPIRKVAELLGYEVEWHQETSSVVIQKENHAVTIKMGDKNFEYNGTTLNFEETPELKNGIANVPETVIEVLLEK